MRFSKMKLSNKQQLITLSGLMLLLIVNLLLARVLQNSINQEKKAYSEQPSAEEILQCRKIGINTAQNMDEFSALVVETTQNINMRWFYGYLSTMNFDNDVSTDALITEINNLHQADIHEPTPYPSDPTWKPSTGGVNVLLRIIAPNPTMVGEGKDYDSSAIADYVNHVANSVEDKEQKIYFVAGHNEPNCREFVPAAEEVSFGKALMDKITAPNVAFVSPPFDVHCGYGAQELYDFWEEHGIPVPDNIPTSLDEYMNEVLPLLEDDRIEAVAISAYNTASGTYAPDMLRKYKTWANSAGMKKPIYITETGMLDQDLGRLGEAFKELLADEDVEAVMIFNAFGNNPYFPYHRQLRCDLSLFNSALSDCFSAEIQPDIFDCEVTPTPSPSASPSPTATSTITSSPTASASPTPTATQEPEDDEVVLPTIPGDFNCDDMNLQGKINYNSTSSVLNNSLDNPAHIPPDSSDITTALTIAAYDSTQLLSDTGLAITVMGDNYHRYSIDKNQLIISELKENFKYSVFINLLDQNNQRCSVKGSFIYKPQAPGAGEEEEEIPNEGIPPSEDPEDDINSIPHVSDYPYLAETEAVKGFPFSYTIDPFISIHNIKNIQIRDKPDWLSWSNFTLSGDVPVDLSKTEETVTFTYQEEGQTYIGQITIKILENEGLIPVKISMKLQGAPNNKQHHGIVMVQWSQENTEIQSLLASANSQGIINTYFKADAQPDKLLINPLSYLPQRQVIENISDYVVTENDNSVIEIAFNDEFIFGDFDKTGSSKEVINTTDYSLFIKYYRSGGPVVDVNRDNTLWAEDRAYMSNNFGKEYVN